MALTKVTAGQPFSPKAETWNAFVDAAIFAKKSGNARGLNIEGGIEYPANTVLCKNNSGADLDALSVVAVSSPIITPSDNVDEFRIRSGWSCNTPTSSDFGNFLVLAESIPNGEIGLAFSGGVVPVQMQIDHATFDRADINAGSAAKLNANYHGSAQILWKESGTGASKWAVVRMGNPQNVSVWGEANADITVGNTGAISVFRNGSDTGFDLEGIHLDILHGNQQISSGKECIATWFYAERRWRFTQAECES